MWYHLFMNAPYTTPVCIRVVSVVDAIAIFIRLDFRTNAFEKNSKLNYYCYSAKDILCRQNRFGVLSMRQSHRCYRKRIHSTQKDSSTAGHVSRIIFIVLMRWSGRDRESNTSLSKSMWGLLKWKHVCWRQTLDNSLNANIYSVICLSAQFRTHCGDGLNVEVVVCQWPSDPNDNDDDAMPETDDSYHKSNSVSILISLKLRLIVNSSSGRLVLSYQ